MADAALLRVVYAPPVVLRWHAGVCAAVGWLCALWSRTAQQCAAGVAPLCSDLVAIRRQRLHRGTAQQGAYHITGDYSYRSRFCAADGLLLDGRRLALVVGKEGVDEEEVARAREREAAAVLRRRE